MTTLERNLPANPRPGGRMPEAPVDQAGEAGLDLSLGHIGTTEGELPVSEAGTYLAMCLACHAALNANAYEALQLALGRDPPCPLCGRTAWEFCSGDD